MYINALGELRATRLYYALCFPLTGQTPYGAFFDTEVDFANRKVPRRDVIMNTAPFKAHEWYHLRLVWDDTLNGNASIDLFVNDERVTPNIATVEEVDELAFNNEYCLLNEREPLDGMFINGFPRAQAKKVGISTSTKTETTSTCQEMQRSISLSLPRVKTSPRQVGTVAVVFPKPQHTQIHLT